MDYNNIIWKINRKKSACNFYWIDVVSKTRTLVVEYRKNNNNNNKRKWKEAKRVAERSREKCECKLILSSNSIQIKLYLWIQRSVGNKTGHFYCYIIIIIIIVRGSTHTTRRHTHSHSQQLVFHAWVVLSIPYLIPDSIHLQVLLIQGIRTCDTCACKMFRFCSRWMNFLISIVLICIFGQYSQVPTSIVWNRIKSARIRSICHQLQRQE